MGKLLIISSEFKSMFLKIFKYLLFFSRAFFILEHSSSNLVFLNCEIFSQRGLNSVSKILSDIIFVSIKISYFDTVVASILPSLEYKFPLTGFAIKFFTVLSSAIFLYLSPSMNCI